MSRAAAQWVTAATPLAEAHRGAGDAEEAERWERAVAEREGG
jgi:hypothetical protein